MKITTFILSLFSVIGAFFSAIYYVLFKQAKDERNLLRKEKEQMSQDQKLYAESKKENEENKNNLFNDDDSGIDAAVNLLQDSSKRGQERNSR